MPMLYFPVDHTILVNTSDIATEKAKLCISCIARMLRCDSFNLFIEIYHTNFTGTGAIRGWHAWSTKK